MLIVDEQLSPLTAKFFSLSGKKLKTMFFEDKKLLEGVYRPTLMKIVDAIQNNQTDVRYLNMKVTPLSNNDFSKERIKSLNRYLTQ